MNLKNQDTKKKRKDHIFLKQKKKKRMTLYKHLNAPEIT